MPAAIGTSVAIARDFLEAGQLVAIPTETVYGLAGNALNADAVTRIFEVKGRPRFDPLIVHVPSWDRVMPFVTNIPKDAAVLASKFWPGPLTLLLPKRPIIHDLVTAGLDRVGLRCPDHVLTRQLLEEIDFPLAAPSANPFGYVSPTTAQHVGAQLGNRIPYILDGGPCRVGIESTIVGWEEERPIVYRLGGVSIEQIETIIGPVSVHSYSTSKPQTPGQMESHYAPSKPFLLGNIEELVRVHALRNPGILSFTKPINVQGIHRTLSPAGDLHEAARNLFGMMRELDQQSVDVVVAELVPNHGLGRAINDRLRRAAAVRP